MRMRRKTIRNEMLAMLLSLVMASSGITPAFAAPAPDSKTENVGQEEMTEQVLSAEEQANSQQLAEQEPDTVQDHNADNSGDRIQLSESDDNPASLQEEIPDTQMIPVIREDEPKGETAGSEAGDEEPQSVGAVEMTGTDSMGSNFRIYEFVTGDPTKDQPVTDHTLDLSKKYYAVSDYNDSQTNYYNLCLIPSANEVTTDLVPVTKKESMTPYPDGLIELYCRRNRYNTGTIYFSNISDVNDGVVGDGFRLEYMRGHGYVTPKIGGGVEQTGYTQINPGSYRFLIYNNRTVYYSEPYTITDTEGLSSVLGTVNARFYDVKYADGSYGVRDSKLKGGRDSLTWLSSRSEKFYLDLSGFEKQIGRPLNRKTDSIHLAYGFIDENFGSSDTWGTWITIWPSNGARAGESEEAKYPVLVDDAANNRQVIEGIELKTQDQGCSYEPMYDGFSYRVVVVLDEYKETNQVYIDNKTFQFIDQADGIRITTAVLPPARAGESYEAELEAMPVKEGARITWSLLDQNEDGTASTLPDGLVFDTAAARISGTPVSVQSTRFTIQAEEEGGKKHKREYTITFRNELSVQVKGLGEKETACLFMTGDREHPENRTYLGVVKNGRNYFDLISIPDFRDKYFFLSRTTAFDDIIDGMQQYTGDERSITLTASPMKGYTLKLADDQGGSLPKGISVTLNTRGGNICVPGNDGVYRVPEGQNVSGLNLTAQLYAADSTLMQDYKLEGEHSDSLFSTEVDEESGTIRVTVPRRKGGLTLSGRIYAKAGDEEFPVPGAVLTVKQVLPGNGGQLTRIGLTRTSGNEAVYTVRDLYEGLSTQICVYASGYGTKNVYVKDGTEFSVKDNTTPWEYQYSFGGTDQSGGNLEIGDYLGTTSVTLLVKGASGFHTVSGPEPSVPGYRYTLADLITPEGIYVDDERGVVRRLGTVSVNKSGSLVSLNGLSDAEKAVYPNQKELYEAYEIEGIPADRLKENSRLRAYGYFGSLIHSSWEGFEIISTNAGKYAEAEASGYGILDVSDVICPENIRTCVYDSGGTYVAPLAQTSRQSVLPEGTYTVVLCPSSFYIPRELSSLSQEEEEHILKKENISVTSGEVTVVTGELKPQESSSYAILNAPEKAAEGELYEVRGIIHPGAEGLDRLRVRAPGLCQIVLDGKTLKGKVYTGSYYCMDYEGLQLKEEAQVRLSIRMPETETGYGSSNPVYLSTWEDLGQGRVRSRDLGNVNTQRTGGISFHIPARADMDIETGQTRIRYHGHASAEKGKFIYLYDNDIPAGTAVTDYYGDFEGELSLATGGMFHTIRASYVFSEREGGERSYDPNDVECGLICTAGQAVLTGITMRYTTGGLSGELDMTPGQAQQKYTVRSGMRASYSATVKNVSVYSSPRRQEADPLPEGSEGKVSDAVFSGLKKFRTFVKGDKIRWRETDSNYDEENHEVAIGTEGVAFFKVKTSEGSFTVPADTYRVNADGTVTFTSKEVDQGGGFTNGVSLLFEAGSDEGYWGGDYYSPAAIRRNEQGQPVDDNGEVVVNEDGSLKEGKELSILDQGSTHYDLLNIRNLSPMTVSAADAVSYRAVRFNSGSENYILEEDVTYGTDSDGRKIPVEVKGTSAENLKRLNMTGLSDNSLVQGLSFDAVRKENIEPAGSGADPIEPVGDAESLMKAISYENFMGYKNTESWEVTPAPAEKPTTLKGIIEERNRQLLENLIAMKDVVENDPELEQNVTRFGMVDEDNARKTSDRDYSLVTMVDYASAVDEKMMDKMGYRETVYEYKTKDENGNSTSETLVMKVYTATTFYKKNGEIIADPALQSYDTAAATLDTYIFYNPEVATAAEDPTITVDLHPFRWTRIQLASMIPGANCPIYTGGFVAPLATWTPTSYKSVEELNGTGLAPAGIASVNGNDVEAAGGTKFKPVENTKVGFFGTGFRFDLNPKNYSDGTKLAGAGLALGYFNKFRNAALKRAQNAAKEGKELKNLKFMDGKGSYSMADDTIRIGKYEKIPGTEHWTIKDLTYYGNSTYQYYTKVEWETAYKSIMNVKVADIVNSGNAGFSALGMYKSYTSDNPPTYKEMMNDTRQQLRDALRWVSQNEDLKKELGEDAHQTLMDCIVDRMNVLTEVEKEAECADHQNEFTGGAGVKVIDGINLVTGLIPDPTGICETISLTSGTVSFVLNAANDNAQAHRLEMIQDYGVKHDMFMTMLMSYGYPPKKDDDKKPGGGGNPEDPENPDKPETPDEVEPGTPESGGGNPPSDTSCIQVQDPSGVVYEAVLSNPVEGATVRLYTADARTPGGESWKPEYEKNEKGTTVFYDEESGSPKQPKNIISINHTVSRNVPQPKLILPENPVQITGDDGRFQWDVTEGLWYVAAQKPGYNTGSGGQSDSQGDTASVVEKDGIRWMPVLPAQLDVNIPMTDETAPFVMDDEEDPSDPDNIRVYEDGVYITFSKYMKEDSLGITAAAVSQNTADNRRTVSDDRVSGNYVICDSLGEEIPYTLVLLDSEQAPENRLNDYSGKIPWYTKKILLQFKESREDTAGEEISIRLISGGDRFKSYADTAMTQDYVSVKKSILKPRTADPVFDPASGTVFEKNGENKVRITCDTEGALIYYTTDGSDPLSGLLPGSTARLYKEPIPVTEDVSIRAQTRLIGYLDSNVVTASYTVKDSGGENPENPEKPEKPGDDDEPKENDFWQTGFCKKLTYTGKKLTQPNFILHYGQVKLILGKDYTVSYKNNLNAGENTAVMTVKGKGDYDMTLEYPYTIQPRSIAEEDFDSPEICVRKPNSGNAKKPKIVLKWGAKTLRQGAEKDYTADDSKVDYGKPGVYTITLRGVKNFTGEYPLEYIITEDTLMSRVNVTGLAGQDWTGEAITPLPGLSAGQNTFVVKFGGKPITKGFTVQYRNNVNAGTAKLILKGDGTDCGDGKGTRFAGTKIVSFKIKGRTIKKAQVTGLPSDAVYTGQAHTPEPELVWDQTKLIRDRDYTVSFTKNTDAGKASVTFTGKGGYTGTLKKTFPIAKFTLEEGAKGLTISVDQTAPYAKSGAKPGISLCLSGNELIPGKDYTVSVKGSKNAGSTRTVTIRGKKNFTGEIKREFDVTVQSLSCMNLTVQDVVYKDRNGNYRTKSVLTDPDGKKLASGTDYESLVTYHFVTVSGNKGRELGNTDRVPCESGGTRIMVTFTAKGGNYSGSVSGIYRVVSKSIATVRFTIPDQIYIPGGAVELSETEIGKIGSTPAGVKVEVVPGSYRNNRKAGKATVTLHGLGDYGGIRTVTYKIRKKGK